MSYEREDVGAKRTLTLTVAFGELLPTARVTVQVRG